MKLTNIIRITGKYKGKSNYDFWHNIEVGDLLEISFDLKPTGSRRGRIYAPDLTATNLRTKVKFSKTINNFQKYLSKLEYETSVSI